MAIENPKLKVQNVFKQILFTGNWRIETPLERFQFERLKQEGFWTNRSEVACYTTGKNWITYTVHVIAKAPDFSRCNHG